MPERHRRSCPSKGKSAVRALGKSRRSLIRVVLIGLLLGCLSAAVGGPSEQPPGVYAAATGRILFGHLGDVWLAENGGLHQVTQGGRYWGQPDWAPDGSRLAAVGWNQSSTDIFVFEPDGSDARQLTRNRQQRQRDSDWLFFPKWAPGGDLIAFLSDRTSEYTMLWTMRADGSNPRQITFPRRAFDAVDAFSWSPDGSQIAATVFAGPLSQIHLIDLSRPQSSRVLTSETGGALDPAWSPDGAHIAYVAREGRNAVIKLVETSGQNPPRVLIQTESARSPRWSPTGTALAYLALAGTDFEVFIANLTFDREAQLVAGRPSQLTNRFGADATSGLSWAP